ncbi:hypothetical protein SprV_0200567400 [Sparganum proliferum]
MYPRYLLLRWKAENVCQEQTVFCAGWQKEEVVVVAAGNSEGNQHSLPGSMICPDMDIEPTKNNQLVRLRHSRPKSVRVLVALMPPLVTAGHFRSVTTAGGGEFGSLKIRAQGHDAVV